MTIALRLSAVSSMLTQELIIRFIRFMANNSSNSRTFLPNFPKTLWLRGRARFNSKRSPFEI